MLQGSAMNEDTTQVLLWRRSPPFQHVRHDQPLRNDVTHPCYDIHYDPAVFLADLLLFAAVPGQHVNGVLLVLGGIQARQKLSQIIDASCSVFTVCKGKRKQNKTLMKEWSEWREKHSLDGKNYIFALYSSWYPLPFSNSLSTLYSKTKNKPQKTPKTPKIPEEKYNGRKEETNHRITAVIATKHLRASTW